MSDTTIQSTDSIDTQPKRKKKAKHVPENTTTDLERDGRDAVPANPVPSALKEPQRMNVGSGERLLSVIGGAAMVAFGITRRGWAGLALAVTGGGLALRGVTGYCPVYAGLDFNSTSGDSRETHGVHVEQAITINASPEELYGFWRDFENQILISEDFTSVTVTGEKTSHWIAKGPAGKTLEWDAEIIRDLPNELIAWQTVPGADIEHAGTVRFKPAPIGRGTEVHVTMQYYPPAGNLGAGIAMLFQKEPSVQAAEALRQFKSLMETGDIMKANE